MGFLSGRYRSEKNLSQSARGKGVHNYLTLRGLNILGALDKVAKRYGTSQATIALAWLIAQPAITARIASATSVEQLQQLMKAATLRLGEQELKDLDETSAY